jgi:asparagine synthase (glutamine-hydrolysing)
VELLPKIIYHADEPFADTSIIPTYLLAEFCRKHVTVCLSGDGGDEIFGGYETYTADKIQHLTGWVPGWLTKSMYRIINRSLPANYNKVSWDYKLRHFLQGHSYPPMRAHYHWRTIFSKEEQKDLLAGSFQDVVEHNPFENFQKYQSHVADCHYLDQAMYVDIKTWLVDDILVKTDRSSMAHALEVRAPLLDYRIVEFAASLPVDLKIKAFEKKYILKKSQDGRISRRILNRKKKGFNAPTSHWIAGPLNRKFDEFNAGIIPGEKSIFNQKFIDTLRTDHLAKKQDNGFKLFSLLCFQIWVQQYQARLS